MDIQPAGTKASAKEDVLMTTCSHCDTPLTGGLDTYGDARAPFCWDCWWNELEDEAWLQAEGWEIWQALCASVLVDVMA